MTYLLAAGLALAHLALRRADLYGASRSIHVSPDGYAYLAMGRGEPQPMVFHLRWLLPKLLGARRGAWMAVTYACLVAMAPLIAWFVEGPAETKLFAAGLYVGLTGVFRFHVLYPVLVDATAMCLALLGACLLRAGVPWPLVVPLALAAGATKETAPVFMAVFAASPAPLLGLLAVAARWKRSPPSNGLGVGLGAHAGRWFAAGEMLLPWGVCLVAAAQLDVWVCAALALAYAQILISTDTVRLYQWAWPLVVAAAAPVVPSVLMVPALLFHWFHPWQERV